MAAIDNDLRRFADRYWDQVLELKPLLATQIGDERFDDLLPDLTDAARERAASLHRQALADVDRFDGESSGREERA